MTHRIALILTPLLMSSILSGCLYSTRTDKLVQQVRINTDPNRADVWQLKNGKKQALGYAPTNLRVPYESTTERVNPAWWWTSIGLMSVASATPACSANELMEVMDKITKTLAQSGDTP